MEHLWIELPGRNKNSKILLVTMNFSDWIQTSEDLLGANVASWDGMLLLAGDINLDMFRPEMSEMKRYNELLDSLNLKQMVTKATRITRTSKTLINHIITNAPKRITYNEVLPRPLVSDRDAPFACVQITLDAPRYKLIRNEKRFSETASIDDFAALPLEIVYVFDDPNDKIATFNRLVVKKCLDRHAPLKRTKVTRSPAPSLNYPSIHSLQVNFANQLWEAHTAS